MSQWIILLAIAFAMLVGCDDTSTGPDGNDNFEATTFESVNVKDAGTQYFQFSSNEGTTDEPESWDIAFSIVPIQVDVGGGQYMTVNDPVILIGPEATATTIDAVRLEDVEEIPAADAFRSDSSAVPYIGTGRLGPQFEVKPNIFAIHTGNDKYAALQFTGYQYDPNTHRLNNISWTYRYETSGSTNLSGSSVDSFTVSESYDAACYFNFAEGEVTAEDSWDLKVDEYSIRMNPNASAIMLDDTTLSDLNAVPGDGYQSDQPAEYVTEGWYNYDSDTHVLTPKDVVYVVQTADGQYAAFEIMDYYDDEGNSGTYEIRWGYLEE